MSSLLKSADPMHAVRLPPAISEYPLYRFSNDQYQRLFDTGILDDSAGVELVDGWVLMRDIAAQSAVKPSDPNIPSRPAFRFSVDDYHAMADAQILQSGDPIELLDGWLVQKMTKNPPHEVALKTLWHLLIQLTPRSHHVGSQSPITCGTAEPEPDISIVSGSPRDYLDRHPDPADIVLVVEVAESTLKTDRTKRSLYGKSGVLEYWIVNLIDRQIEVYTQPSGPKKSPGYGQRQDYLPGQMVPLAIVGKKVGDITVNDILP